MRLRTQCSSFCFNRQIKPRHYDIEACIVQRNVQTMKSNSVNSAKMQCHAEMQNERSRCEIRTAQDNNFFSIGASAGLSRMLMIFTFSSLATYVTVILPASIRRVFQIFGVINRTE